MKIGKKRVLAVVLLLLIGAGMAGAAGNILGAGIILGEPSGLCAKLFLGPIFAVDAAFSWSFFDARFHVHGDFLFHLIDPFAVEVGDLDFYLGAGALVKFGTPFKFGLRVPVGMAYAFETIPIDLFLELVPILELIPATVPSFGAGIGIRFYFINEKG